MQKKSLFVGLAFIIASSLKLSSQEAKQENTFKRWWVGSTLYLLGNLDKTNNPEYVQINVGYRITPKDVVSFRFKRSIYSWPIGIPFTSPSFDAPGENYPGHARILAPTIGYQRFLWKGAYVSVQSLNAFEKYYDENKKEIGKGYTMYIDSYVGYQFRFFKNRVFFEPGIGVSYWPLRTNVPDSFKAADKKWPNYFVQPNLDFGFNF